MLSLDHEWNYEAEQRYDSFFCKNIPCVQNKGEVYFAFLVNATSVVHF